MFEVLHRMHWNKSLLYIKRIDGRRVPPTLSEMEDFQCISINSTFQ